MGYPLPNVNTSIAANNFIENATNREFGCSSFYTKKIVQVSEELNPSFTKSLWEFDSDTALATIVMQYPVCYFADTVAQYSEAKRLTMAGIEGQAVKKKMLFVNDNAKLISDTLNNQSNIIIKQFAPWGLAFEVTTEQPRPFVLFQNYNANWKAFVDDKETKINKGNISFMYSLVSSGNHTVRFEYKPAYILPALIASLLTLLATAITLIVNRRKN